MSVNLVGSIGHAGSATANSISLAVPSGEVGDLLVCIPTADWSVNSQTLSMSGWNKIGQDGNSSSDVYIGAFWKVATATSEGNATVTMSSNAYPAGHIMRFNGQDESSPIGATFFDWDSAVYGHRVASIDTTQKDSRVLVGLGYDGADGNPFSLDPPDEIIAEFDTPGQTGGGVSQVVGFRDVDGVGSSGSSMVYQASGADGAAFCRVEIKSEPRLYLSDYLSKTFDGGTWTPTLESGSCTPANGNYGAWQRNGNMVHVVGMFSCTSFSGTDANEVIFGGLPFTIKNNNLPNEGSLATGNLTPFVGMQMNENPNDGSNLVHAFHQICPVGIEGTNTYRHLTYFGTNDDQYADWQVFSKHRNFSSTCQFAIYMTYETSDP